MKSVWLAGFSSKEDKERRTQQIKSFKPAFEELKSILEQEFKRKESVRDYDVPNWEYRQIAVNEYNQVLRDVIDLITIKES